MHPNPGSDALAVAADCLNRSGLEWMLVGSVAAFLYGHQRSTQDIDVLFEPKGVNPAVVARAFEPDYMLDPLMLEDTLRTGIMANALALRGGPKIDLSPLGREAFMKVAFQRRAQIEWHGFPLFVIQAADLVVSKLLWARESRSERQLADIRAIMATGRVNEHDEDFNHWVDQLALRDLLDASRETRYDA